MEKKFIGKFETVFSGRLENQAQVINSKFYFRLTFLIEYFVFRLFPDSELKVFPISGSFFYSALVIVLLQRENLALTHRQTSKASFHSNFCDYLGWEWKKFQLFLLKTRATSWMNWTRLLIIQTTIATQQNVIALL